jgi:hypothetical protein
MSKTRKSSSTKKIGVEPKIIQNNEDSEKPKNRICCAIKPGNVKCTNKASKKCGFKYCLKHKNKWLTQTADGKQLRLCNSRYRCTPAGKTILPEGYTKLKCENCLKRERKNYQKKKRKKN